MNKKFCKKFSLIEGNNKLNVLWCIMLNDNVIIEASSFMHNNKLHLCIPSQAGCSQHCKFCATTYAKPSFIRNLTCDELCCIFNMIFQHYSSFKKVMVVSFSGHGEPLMNWESVKNSIDIISNTNNIEFNITTVGIINKMNDLLSLTEIFDIHVYLSMHGGNDDKRFELIPYRTNICSCMNLLEFASKCIDNDATVALNYILLDNNTSSEDAIHLAGLLNLYKNKPRIRLMKYNPLETQKCQLICAKEKQICLFIEQLRNNCNDLNINYVESVGWQNNIACGQLRAKYKDMRL